MIALKKVLTCDEDSNSTCDENLNTTCDEYLITACDEDLTTCDEDSNTTCDGPSLWNNLDNTLRKIVSPETLKRKLKHTYINLYTHMLNM